MLSTKFFSIDVDNDGIAILTWDVSGSAVNVFSEPAIDAYKTAIKNLTEDAAIKGVIITSAKKVFHVGADLEMAQTISSRPANVLFNIINEINGIFRTMETSNKPFVAAINGHALGGGLEMAMSCHARLVANTPKITLGLPEAKLGLMPGFGGTQRLPRLIALEQAIPMMLTGAPVNPEKALSLGLIDAIVPERDLLTEAKQWIKANPEAVQRWDKKGFKLPSGSIHSPKNAQFFIGASAQARKLTGGHIPAIPAILEAVYHGLQLHIGAGLRMEARRFVRVAKDTVSSSMIRTLFFGLNDANQLVRRPQGPDTKIFKTLGVVGAGLMGSGIAYQAARAGVSVIVLDTTEETANKALAYSSRLMEKAQAKGAVTQEKADAHMARITTTTHYNDLATCNIVIEAVFEDKTVKENVLKQVDAVLPPDTIIASNTSTIPITELSDYVTRPERFIGLHFFSPVEKMPLVEIISSKHTSSVTLAHAYDLCKTLRKTPIDVNDGRAFFTTRVVASYMTEGMALLAEGADPVLIENAGLQLGMPMGPLRVADMVNLDLVTKIDSQSKADLGDAYKEHPGIKLARQLVSLKRFGEKSKAGFYDYATKKPQLWRELKAQLNVPDATIDIDTIKKRLLTIQMVETLRCFDAGVLKTAEDANIGSILGWGFPPFTGGVASYIDTLGAKQVHENCLLLENTAGERFSPPKKLLELVSENTTLLTTQ